MAEDQDGRISRCCDDIGIAILEDSFSVNSSVPDHETVYRRGMSHSESIFQTCEHGSTINNMRSPSYSALNDQTRLPRPCYYLLRILGAWQPREAYWFWHGYSVLCFGVFLMSMGAILVLGYVNKRGGKIVWSLGELLNSFCTVLNLGCPFVFLKYYFQYGNFDKLIASVLQTTSSNQGKVVVLARLYTLFSCVIWATGTAFFLLHWIPFFHEYWHYAVYIPTVIFTNGWWAVWLSIYGFVCNIHRLQAKNFITFMQERYKLCRGSAQEEKRAVGNLLCNFNELQRWIDRSQSDFNKIISFAIFYHILDMFAFSYAYWHKDFGDGYSIWQYIGGMLFDFSSIAIKLCPVAFLSSAVHEITTRCGKECFQMDTLEYPVDRFLFFSHVVNREVDFGLRILGVKVTMKMAVGVLVTIATATATFLRFVIPKLTASLF